MSKRWLPLVCLLLAFGGCGRGGDERAVRDVAERFETALEQRDGAAACEELSESTASELESQEERPCEQAILSIPPSPRAAVAHSEVWHTSARVDLEAGDTLFLDQTSAGWKVGAAACEQVPGRPYDCKLEG